MELFISDVILALELTSMIYQTNNIYNISFHLVRKSIIVIITYKLYVKEKCLVIIRDNVYKTQCYKFETFLVAIYSVDSRLLDQCYCRRQCIV